MVQDSNPNLAPQGLRRSFQESLRHSVKTSDILQVLHFSDEVSTVGKIPWSRQCQPTPFSCLGNPRTEEPGGLQFMTLQRAGHKQHKLFWVLFHGHMLN